jgi:hypothetical protein
MTELLRERDHWLTDKEKQEIIRYHFDHPLNGYRRLTTILDRMIGQCWEAPPGGIITAPSRCQRQVPLAFGHNALKPGGLGAEPPRTPSICFVVHLRSLT